MNGVDVEFVPAAHDAIEADAQLAVCQQFGQDEQVFAALAGRDFPDGAECMASRFNTPIISVNQMPAALYAQAGPNLFTVKPDETTILTAFGNWAIENGYLDGKTVGIYWETPAQAAVDAIKQILTDAGVNIASEVQSGGEGVGAEQDALAAQRFQADGVDMVIPIVGSSSIINFTAAAAEQGYNPGYIDTDWASHLADVATAAYAPGQYTDVPALASVRAGDLSVGLSPEAEECLANYEEFSGKTIPRTTPEQSGEYTNILITCDLANLMVEALTIATTSVTPTPPSAVTSPGAVPASDRADHRLPRCVLGDGQLLARRSQRCEDGAPGALEPRLPVLGAGRRVGAAAVVTPS